MCLVSVRHPWGGKGVLNNAWEAKEVLLFVQHHTAMKGIQTCNPPLTRTINIGSQCEGWGPRAGRGSAGQGKLPSSLILKILKILNLMDLCHSIEIAILLLFPMLNDQHCSLKYRGPSVLVQLKVILC